MPHGTQAAKSLKVTFREALRFGHNYIGTEHIFLATLEIGSADGILTTALGIKKPVIEQHIMESLQGQR